MLSRVADALYWMGRYLERSENITRLLLVTEDFAAKHPQAVQRVVTTLVKVAHRYSNEANRAELFERWGKTEYPEKIWREDFIGQPLRVRLSPLLDPFLVSRYKEAAKDAHALKLTRSVPEIDSTRAPGGTRSTSS